MVRSSYVHTYVFSYKVSLITRFFEFSGELIQFAKKKSDFFKKISKNREFRRDKIIFIALLLLFQILEHDFSYQPHFINIFCFMILTKSQ